MKQKKFFLQGGMTRISVLALGVLLVSAVALPFITQLVGERTVIRQRASYLATPPVVTPPFIESTSVCYNNRTERQTGPMTCWEGEYSINYTLHSSDTTLVEMCFSDSFSLARNTCYQREAFYANRGTTTRQKQISATFCEDVVLALHKQSVEDPYQFVDTKTIPQQSINQCSAGQVTPTVFPCPSFSDCPFHSRGDADCDGEVSIYDYEYWRQEFLGLRATMFSNFNCATWTPGAGTVDIYDYETWRDNFTGLIQTTPTPVPP